VLFAVMLVITATAAHGAIRLLVLCIDKSNDAELTARPKYTSLGSAAFGKRGEIAAAACVALQQIGPCVMYIQISADVLVPILCEFGGTGIWCSTAFWQILAVVVIVFPICLIRRMDSLKHISAVAMFFILAFSVTVVIRGIWVLTNTGLREEDYRAIEKHWDTANSTQCSTSTYHDGCYEVVPPGDDVYLFRAGKDMLNAFPILCFAFLCHQNMFPIYEDLEDRNHTRMTSASLISMLLCVCLYFSVGVFGYLTFLESNQPNVHTGKSGDVLVLFAVQSKGFDFALVMDILRVGYGISLILSYPVMLFELRHILEKYAVGDDADYSLKRHLIVNFVVISVCTAVAINVQSVGTMFGLIGSTTSPCIVFILPSVFYLKLRPDGKARPFAWILGAVGIILVPVSLWAWATGL